MQGEKYIYLDSYEFLDYDMAVFEMEDYGLKSEDHDLTPPGFSESFNSATFNDIFLEGSSSYTETWEYNSRRYQDVKSKPVRRFSQNLT